MSFENNDPAKMLIDFNGIKTYEIGGSLTLEELDDAFQSWKKHCFTWKNQQQFKVYRVSVLCMLSPKISNKSNDNKATISSESLVRKTRVCGLESASC
mgnify:CR=1 FL=1